MAGMFDDLIPRQPGAPSFDDLIPSAQPAQPAGATSSPVSPSSASPAPSGGLKSALPPNLTYLPDFMSNWNRALDAAYTFGLSDKVHSWLAGTDVAQQRAQTQAAQQAIGPVGRATADIGAYLAGPGEAKIAANIGGALAPTLARLPLTGQGRWLGGVLGSAGEGGLLSGAAAAGGGGSLQDVEKAAGTGAAIGGAAGTLGGVVGRGGTLAPGVSEDALRAQATQAYAPLQEGIFHGPNQIDPVLDAVTSTMSGRQQELAKSTLGQVDKLRQSLVSGRDIQMAQRELNRIGGQSAQIEDRTFAPKFSNALQGVLENTQPYGRNLTPGAGMNLVTQGQLGATVPPAGAMAAAKAAGDQWYGMAEDVNRVFGQGREPQPSWAEAASRGGTDVGTAVQKWLPTAEGARYAPQPPPGQENAYTAYQNVAKTAGPNLSLWPSTFDLRHATSPVIGAGTGLAFGLEQHHDPATIAEEMLAGGLAGFGVHRAVPYAYQRMVTLPARARAIDALNTTLSTGQYAAPLAASAPVRDALRALLFSRAQSGS